MPDNSQTTSLVEMKSIVKDFASTRALDRVSLHIRRGEVHGLIGENGAGKSTLMNILGGALTPTSGELLLRGVPVQFRGPADAQACGIAMIHQELNVVGELSVAENMLLGHEPVRRGLIDRRGMRVRAQELLDSIGCRVDPARKVRRLSIAEQQMVEIAKALSQRADVLIMDEPTAVLTQREVRLLMELIRGLRSRGVAVVYISHILPEVLGICDRVTVLRDGAVVHDYTGLAGVSERDLARQMVGRELREQFPARGTPQEREVLRVEGLTVPGRVEDVSFAVHAGEILGFGGLIGAGRTEVGEAVAGLRPRRAGVVSVDGCHHAVRTPWEAVAAGIAYVSEDRRGAGLVMGMSIVENTTLAALRQYGCVLVDRRREASATEQHVRDLAVKTGRLTDRIETLSGGNQQKIALAKWLETRPRVLILDEPTRGIDVGAKAEIYRVIHRLAAAGMACILISSEMTELLGLCHRIAVMRNGAIRAWLAGAAATEDVIMQAAAGVDDPVGGGS
jgi:ribose transport system ATP-binding protein